MMLRRIVILLVLLLALASSRPSIANEACDALLAEYQRKQAEVLEIEAAMEFAQQFELVQRTLDEIKEVADETAKDTGDVQKKINKLLELTRTTQTEIGRVAKQVADGLGSSSSQFKKVSGAIKEINQSTKFLEQIVAADGATPAQSLVIFKDYFASIRQKIGPLVDRLPALGAFFEIYERAIQSAAEIAEQLEKTVNERDQLMREAGPDGAGDLYLHAPTPTQRLAAHRRQLYQELEELNQRLLDECTEQAAEVLPSDTLQKVRELARKACNNAQQRQLSRDWLEAGSQHRLAIKERDAAEEAFLKAQRQFKNKYDPDLKASKYESDLANAESKLATERGKAKPSQSQLDRHEHDVRSAKGSLKRHAELRQRDLDLLRKAAQRLREANESVYEMHSAKFVANCARTRCEREWIRKEIKAKNLNLEEANRRFPDILNRECDFPAACDQDLSRARLVMPKPIVVTTLTSEPPPKVTRGGGLVGGVQYVPDRITAQGRGSQSTKTTRIQATPRLRRTEDGCWEVILEVPALEEEIPPEVQRVLDGLRGWSKRLREEQLVQLQNGEDVELVVGGFAPTGKDGEGAESRIYIAR